MRRTSPWRWRGTENDTRLQEVCDVTEIWKETGLYRLKPKV